MKTAAPLGRLSGLILGPVLFVLLLLLPPPEGMTPADVTTAGTPE